MARNKRTEWLALTTATLVFLGMGYFGFKMLTAPLPNLANDNCTTKTEQTKIYRKDITVSVYNASDKSGWAQTNLDRLEELNFQPGEINNLSNPNIARVQVWTEDVDSLSAKLVANQFKPPALIKLSTDELGPGIDVIVGKKLKGIPGGPRSIKGTVEVTKCQADL